MFAKPKRKSQANVERCPHCQAPLEKQEDEDGQVTCAKCGVILETASQIQATQEVLGDVFIPNLNKRARNAPKVKGKTKEKAVVVKRTSKESIHFCFNEIYKALVNVIGIADLDKDDIEKKLEEELKNPSFTFDGKNSVNQIFKLVYENCLDKVITAWDFTHFGNVGAVPIISVDGMERGPYTHFLYSSQKKYDDEVVALRFAFRLAKFCKIELKALWRALWMVLYAYQGKLAFFDQFDAPQIAASLVVAFTLLNNWEEKIRSVIVGSISQFSFSPIHSYISSENLLEEITTSKEHREYHYHRQSQAYDWKKTRELNESFWTYPNELIESIVSARIPKNDSNKSGDCWLFQQNECSGDCLKGLIREDSKGISKRITVNLPIRSNLDKIYFGDETNEDLSRVERFVFAGLDNGLGLKMTYADFHRTVMTVVLHIRLQTHPLLSYSDFEHVTARIVKLGCKNCFCCLRIDNTEKVKINLLDNNNNKKTKPKGAPKKRKSRCKVCANCARKDCGICRNCLDMKKFGGRSLRKKMCIERTCLNPISPEKQLSEKTND